MKTTHYYNRFSICILFLFFAIPSLKAAISTANSIGTPHGQFEVSATGGATYSVSIECPIGVGGMQPDIALSYNSQGGYGLAGFGFNISGLSVISRGQKNRFYDEEITGMTYCEEDPLYIDGKRLILYKGHQGEIGSSYSIEGDPYGGATIRGNGNDIWMDVWFQNGSKYEYGRTDNSRLSYSTKYGAKRIYSWYISRAEDVCGNFMTYTYGKKNLTVYPIEIKYGGNSNAGTLANNAVKFYYDTLDKSPQSFVLEDAKGDISIRLSEIKTRSGNSLYRSYALSYNTSSDNSLTKFSRLTKIEVSNSNNEKFNPIEFNWEYLTSGTQVAGQPMDFPLLEDNDPNVSIIDDDVHLISTDINGDGICDIIRLSQVKIKSNASTNTYAYFFCSSRQKDGTIAYSPIRRSLGPQINCEEFNAIMGGRMILDYDGDGLNDVIFTSLNHNNNTDTKWIHLSIVLGKNIIKGYAGGKEIYAPIKDTSEMPLCVISDFNKDNLDDIFYIEPKSVGSNLYPAYLITDHSDAILPVKPIETTLYLPKKPKRIFSGDFNSDGLHDIIIFDETGYSIYFYNHTSNEFTFINLISDEDFGKARHIEQGDFNGDGLIDFIFVGKNSYKYYFALNNGDGTFSKRLAYDFETEEYSSQSRDNLKNNDHDKFSMTVYDRDCDGKSDVLILNSNSATSCYWMRSDGSKLHNSRNCIVQKDDYSSCADNIMVGDFRGLGFPEIMNYGSNIYTSVNSGEKQLYHYREYANTPNKGKIVKITDGLGRTTEIKYTTTSFSDTYTHLYDAATPLIDNHSTFAVVKSVTQESDCTGPHTVTYAYEGLKSHVDKGLLGYKRVTITDETGNKTSTCIDEWDSTYFLPSKVTKTSTVGDETSTEELLYSFEEYTYSKTFKCNLSNSIVTDMDGNVTRTAYEYDFSAAQLTSETTTYDEFPDMYKKSEYKYFFSTYGGPKPMEIKSITKHADDPEESVTVYDYTYESRGFATKVIANPKDSSNKITTEYTYDDFGNLLTSVSTGENMPTIKKISQYDSTGRFLIKESTDPETSVIEYTYDPWGNVLTETDKTNPNGELTTTYNYNNWGELSSTTSPSGAVSTVSREWGNSLSDRYHETVSESGSAPVTTYYDASGREMKSETLGFNDYQIVNTNTYDSLGQLVTQKIQNGVLSISSQFTYDTRGRLLTKKMSNRKGLTNKYGNRWIETSSSDMGTVKKAFDPWGNLLKATRLNTSVEYNYNSNGHPSKVTPTGTVPLTMKYDINGNRIELDDKATGKMITIYTPDGRIATQTDARGIIKKNTYNDFGQLVKSDVGGDAVNYTYGTEGNAKMQLTQMYRWNYAITYDYDKYHRVITEKRYNPIIGMIEFGFAYDSIGNIIEKRFPGNVTVQYTYDDYGNKTGAKVNGKEIYTLTTHDGSKSVWKNGNTIMFQMIRDEDGYIRQLNQNVTNRYGANWFYDVNVHNDITRRVYTRNGSVALDESFGYDDFNRLRESHTSTGNHNVTSFTPNGNVASKTGLGRFTYSLENRVSSVENTDSIITGRYDYSYNAFGKIMTIVDVHSAEQHVVQAMAIDNVDTTENLLFSAEDVAECMAIAEDAEEASVMSVLPTSPNARWQVFEYWPDMTLAFTQYQDPNSKKCYQVLTTDDYEVVVRGNKRLQFCYIDGMAVLVKDFDKESDESDILYLSSDNLGSIWGVTEISGIPAFEATYDAWGKQKVLQNGLPMMRGYCGHHMISEFDLIHMDGRVYDPIIGRFISPDNYVQLPDDAQSFNRYTYCLNNPLRYTDPNGEWWGVDDLIFGAIGFVTGYLSNAISSGNWGWSSIQSGLIGGVTTWLSANLCGADSFLSHTSKSKINWGAVGKYAAATTASIISPSTTIPINSHLAVGGSMLFSFGSGGICAGLGVGIQYSEGKFKAMAGFGAGTNYYGWSSSVKYGQWGAGYGRTTYSSGDFHGELAGSQTLGTLSLYFPYKASINFSNDCLGDREDRWRTNFIDFSVAQFSIGSFVSTNWGRNASELSAKPGEKVFYEKEADSPIGKNKNGNGAWLDGRVYFAPAWVGYRTGNTVIRAGFSHKSVQNITQNLIHKNVKFAATHYFLNYEKMYTGGYFHYGRYNPFTPFGY